jgi:deoxyribose-phosphate aldolase
MMGPMTIVPVPVPGESPEGVGKVREPKAGPPNRAELAQMIDHTLLRPEVTGEEIVALCTEARDLGVATVCVAPTHVYLAAACAREHGLAEEPAYTVASVVGFPFGTHLTAVKAEEARLAVTDGANEIDIVIDLACAVDENWRSVEAEIAAIRLTVPPHIVIKVILETAALTDHAIVAGCRAAEAAGAEFVKTSTGFHPTGGASLHAVRLMNDTIGGRLGIKASGGIRTAEAALGFVAAGATRIGASASKAILADVPE